MAKNGHVCDFFFFLKLNIFDIIQLKNKNFILRHIVLKPSPAASVKVVVFKKAIKTNNIFTIKVYIGDNVQPLAERCRQFSFIFMLHEGGGRGQGHWRGWGKRLQSC